MAQAHDAPAAHMTAREQAVHDAKMEIEGERLVNAALDKTHPHGFRDELAQITDPKEQQEALAAAKAYEHKREVEGKTNPNLPTVQFFESDGKLGQVVVRDHGSRVAYDANGQDDKTTKEKVVSGAKGVWGHIKVPHM